jgi:hypothetical protein
MKLNMGAVAIPIIVAIIIVGGLGYWLFFQSSEDTLRSGEQMNEVESQPSVPTQDTKLILEMHEMLIYDPCPLEFGCTLVTKIFDSGEVIVPKGFNEIETLDTITMTNINRELTSSSVWKDGCDRSPIQGREHKLIYYTPETVFETDVSGCSIWATVYQLVYDPPTF